MRTEHLPSGSDYSVRFRQLRQLVAAEGGAVYAAYQDGHFYLTSDESTLADFLGPEDHDLAQALVSVTAFDDVDEFDRHVSSREWYGQRRGAGRAQRETYPAGSPPPSALVSNSHMLQYLFASGQIDLQQSGLFDQAPGPMPAGLDLARIEGMLLGAAIGDGLGNTTEAMLPGKRRASYGEIRDYLPNGHAGGQRVGVPSDDSQLTFWTLEQLLADDGLDPDRLANRFSREPIFGIGSAVEEFVANCRSGQLPWYRCGAHSAGNGALMRAAPLLLPHLRHGGADLWADVALASMLTHNDAGSTAACLAFAHMLWQLLQMPAPPPAEWWLHSYVSAARDVEGETTYRSRPGADAYQGPIWRLVEERVARAYEQHLSVLEACSGWYSGAYLLETVPCVIYILMRHADDAEEAIVRAVNDTRDNDTVAAIVGAAVGALHGASGLPERWKTALTGRTGANDDGRVFELIDRARQWL